VDPYTPLEFALLQSLYQQVLSYPPWSLFFLNVLVLPSGTLSAAPGHTDFPGRALGRAFFGLVPFALLLVLLLIKFGEIQSESLARAGSHVFANTHKAITSLIKHVLQANHNALKVRLAALCNVIAHLAQVDCEK
jgi:hypothetical protein